MHNSAMTISETLSESQWNDFLLRQNPNTFLQSWEWGQVQRRTGQRVMYLALHDNGQQIGAALVITVNAKRGRHYLIPHGPIVRSGDGFLQACLNEFISFLRQRASRDRVVALRIAPLLLHTDQSQQLYKNLGFRPAPLHVHAELTWVRDITMSEEQILGDMRKTTRHAIRRALSAGVNTEILSRSNTNLTAVLDRFYHLYEQTQSRHNFVPYSRATLSAQLEEFGRRDRVFAIAARHEKRDVAAAICFQFGSTAFYYHGASRQLPANVPAAQLVQWEAMAEAKRRGAVRYNFWGISPPAVNSPNILSFTLRGKVSGGGSRPHPFAGITVFKKGFGGYAIDYLHAQDLPLSWRYWQLWLVDKWRQRQRGFS